MKNRASALKVATVAQSAERLIRNQQVGGSSPSSGLGQSSSNRHLQTRGLFRARHDERDVKALIQSAGIALRFASATRHGRLWHSYWGSARLVEDFPPNPVVISLSAAEVKRLEHLAHSECASRDLLHRVEQPIE